MKLSQRQYITRGGTHCPVCGKQTVESHRPEIEEELGIDIIRHSKCGNQKCGATWNEVYVMKGYADVHDQNGSPIKEKEPS